MKSKVFYCYPEVLEAKINEFLLSKPDIIINSVSQSSSAVTAIVILTIIYDEA